jgi:LysM repeat protein
MVIELIKTTRTRGTPSRVMISRAVIENLLGASGSADSQQVDRAGLLVGRLTSDANGINITVLDTVELPGVPLKAEPPGLLIALADNLRRKAQAAHVGKEIVGWFHTHLGSGVAASGEDAMVHKSLSPLGAGVALIVDPVQHEASFFYMDEEALLPFPGYYMFDSIDESSGQSLRGPAAAQASRRVCWPFKLRSDDTRLALRIAFAALVIAVIALTAQIWAPRNTTQRLASEPQPELRPQLQAELQVEIEPSIQPQAEPQAQPQAAPEPEPQQAQAESQAQQAQVATHGNAPRVAVRPGEPGTVIVTVAPGESVAVIAKRLYGRATDERMREILAMNGITDPRKISPGTTLVCPKPPGWTASPDPALPPQT